MPHPRLFLILNVQRALLDFVVDASDVFAENANRQKLHACEEHDGCHERSPAGNGGGRGEELFKNRPDEHAKADDSCKKSQIKADFERCGIETRDAVERETQHLLERILRCTCRAFCSVVFDANLLEANPAHESTQEAAAFGEVLELIDNAAVHESKVAGVRRNVDARELADDAVETERRKAFEKRFSGTLVALGINHLITFTPLFHHHRDKAWRVLKVSVNNDDCIALCMVEACTECGLVPEVTAEVDNLVAWRCREQFFKDFASAVLGTVVHENEFVLDVLEFFFQDAERLGHNFFFVKNRNNYR